MIKRYNSRICCVPGCKSKEGKDSSLEFHRFPGRPYEIERRKKWIISVRRISIDNKPWQPSQNTRICSLHFVGGKKSNDPRKEAYNPTIFPWKPEKKLAEKRAERLENRRKNINLKSASLNRTNDEVHDVEMCDLSHFPTRLAVEVEIQTDFDPQSHLPVEIPEIFMSCWLDGINNEASTQTTIRLPHRLTKNKCNQGQTVKKLTRDVAVGTGVQIRIGFTGFSDIMNDTTMKQLGGVSLSFFNSLLKCMILGPKQPCFVRTLDNKNGLFLFLMKLKLGLNFTALASVFQVSMKTAAEIFYDVLENIFQTTKTWLFWPSKEAIKETMPECFKNYPNCRAVIDCIELPCDTPSTVEQRILMYSSYKLRYTVKFLIAVTPSGFISFVSKAYGGRSTDGYIANDSGFINLIEPGDEIMANKGFPQIKTELLKCKSTLIMPPFASKPQFSREEVLEGYSIASVRIHVERAIGRLKYFKILDHISIELMEYINKIMYVICVIANNEPLIKTEGST